MVRLLVPKKSIQLIVKYEHYGKKFDMTKVSEMKDIADIVDSELKFDKHINTKIETANKILGIIRRSFIYLDAVDKQCCSYMLMIN